MSARRYEGLFLIDNNRANQAWDQTVSDVEALLKKHGGEVVKAIKWDERKLAFEIKGHRRGTYLLTYFDIAPPNIDELRVDLELSEVVLRTAIVRLTGEMLDSPDDMFADGAKFAAASAGPPVIPSTPTPGPLSQAPAPAEAAAAAPAAAATAEADADEDAPEAGPEGEGDESGANTGTE